jgi:YbbR domain-containing protein
MMKILENEIAIILTAVIIVFVVFFIYINGNNDHSVNQMKNQQYLKQLKIDNISEEEINDGHIKIRGYIKNTLDKDISYIAVMLYLKDEEGNIIHDDICNELYIRKEQTWEFEFNIFSCEYASYMLIIDEVEV